MHVNLTSDHSLMSDGLARKNNAKDQCESAPRKEAGALLLGLPKRGTRKRLTGGRDFRTSLPGYSRTKRRPRPTRNSTPPERLNPSYHERHSRIIRFPF